ncbi:MAG TPA: DegT/DnrJ/EryC1/StrS family aminotransferase [Chitinivibrionales bacterium]|nr:DegT/DnrJ/EryC1/StrS family aminotransferase [Chitinivibrionales bacterium]
MPQQIPFLDLVTPHRDLKSELLSVLEKAIDSAGYIGGPMVKGFEEEFARFCNVKHCVAVNSGTDALRFAYIAGGIRPGDEVITVPNTFIATTESITQAGAHILFVDISEKTYNLDPQQLRAFLEKTCAKDRQNKKTINKQTGRRVAAVVPVHLYGQMADMDAIIGIAEEWHLMVFEDACQAHGAEYHSKRNGEWRRAGSLGKATGFSFYPGKNLGALGEGGAITTNDDETARICRCLRDHGQARKYYHDMEGYNGRLDAIQCGFLSVKLRHLPEWTAARRRNANRYNELLKSADGVIAPFEPDWSRAVYHLYIVRVKNRDAVQQRLAETGIGSGMHYPVPLHLQKAYGHLGYGKGDFPVTEKAAAEILSLPMFPGLTKEQQESVVRELVR